MRVVVTFLMIWLFVPDSSAQIPLGWSGDAWVEVDRLTKSSQTWSSRAVGVARRGPKSSVRVDLGQARRPGRSDDFGILDVYRSLWDGAYANARLRAGHSNTIVPEADLLLELYQSVDRWEVSLGYRGMRFPDAAVDIGLASVALYHGAWYSRLRLTVLPDDVSGALGLQSRRYLRGSSQYVEFSAAYGQEVLETGAATVIIQRSWSAGARFELYPFRYVGLGAGAQVHRGGALERWTMNARLLLRVP